MESSERTSAAVEVEALLADMASDLARVGKPRLLNKNLPGLGTVYQRGKAHDPARPPIWWIKYSIHGRRLRESSKARAKVMRYGCCGVGSRR